MTLNRFGTPLAHYAALAQLFERYGALAAQSTSLLAPLPARCQGPALVTLCRHAIDHGSDYPFDKMNRWMGFVQGVLAAQGIIDVDAERDVTRPLLHALHEQPVSTWAT